MKPPRALFVNFPMGNNFGAAGDVDMQQRILRAALELVDTASAGGDIVDFPDSWPGVFDYAPGGKKVA